MTSQDSCCHYTLTFLFISLFFEISKTLLTIWRQRTRQGELYLLDSVGWISPVFKLDHWNIHIYVCVYLYAYIHTCFIIYICVCVCSFHWFRIHYQCFQLQCVNLDQVYSEWPFSLQKNNQAYAWSAQEGGSLRGPDGNKYSSPLM